MIKEYKYIIVKGDAGRLYHFKSDILHHWELARGRGYDIADILESGLFISGQIFILECNNREHLLKHKGIYLGNILQDREAEGEALNLLATQWLKSRTLESAYYYTLKPAGQLGEGD